MTSANSLSQAAKPQADDIDDSNAASKPVKKSAGAFRTISEVADELGVQQHVLRFWETKFTQIKPLKRGGGRRYYRPEDVALLKRIHTLLYTEGYTIKGVQKLLRGQGKQQIVQQQAAANEVQQQPPVATQLPQPSQSSLPLTPQTPAAPHRGLSDRHRAVLEDMLGELREMREMVRAS
ncbi:MAG: MerR family transcriptional regulator [Alphaproteobacteria bacterium]|nr:MerR family transcriptional regulator [Alphaproteobacteria bacterium]